MSKTAMIAKLPIAAGKKDEAVAALRTMIDHVHTEDGTLTYILHEDTANPDVLWMYEIYADKAAQDAHGSSDAMKALFGALGPMMGGAPELIGLAPIVGKGL